MKRISIIIPVYNGEKYIKDCLESLSIHTLKNAEVIIIDDGSTDKTSNICDEFAKTNRNVIVHHIENSGVSAARNYGINKATGEFIMFVDSDDQLTQGWNDIIDEIGDNDMVILDERISTSDVPIIRDIILGKGKNRIIISAPTSKIYNRKFLKKNNIYFEEDIAHGEDMLFLLKIIENTKKIKVINKKIYNYKIREESLSRAFDRFFLESDKKFHEKIKSLNLDNQERQFLVQNAIFIIVRKASKNMPFKEAVDFYKILRSEEPYASALNEKTFLQQKYRFFVSIYKHKMYRILYNLLRIIP